MCKNTLKLAVSLVLCLGLTVVHADLVGHWTLDEGSGMTAFDATENGNDGTLRGDPQWVEGMHKGALHFDADDDVDCGNAPILNLTSDFSIAVWMNPDKDQSVEIAPLCKATSGAAGWSWQLRYGWSSPQPDMGFQFNATGGRVWVYTNTELVVGEWYHVAATHDGSTAKCYLNGEETDSKSMGAINAGADSTFYIGQDGWNDNWEGLLDDVRLYNHGMSPEEVIEAMLGAPPELSSNPLPENEAIDISRDVILSWSPGEFAATHNLYVGESFDDVSDATVPIGSGVDVNSFDPGRLDFGKAIFWRVDEVNGTADKTVFKGGVWSFEVEPYSIQIAGSDIMTTASSFSNAFSMPETTSDGSGLSDNGAHATEPETMWFTQMADPEPWIQYEFDGVKKLDTMKVWNSNSAAEAFLGYGVKGVEITYSVDGETWDVLVDVNEFSRAIGLATYDQYDEIPFEGVAAKMVRLNIQSNWGDVMPSYSLSEIQFNVIPVAARTPVPASGAMGVVPDEVVSWRAGREAAQSTVYVSTDVNEVADGLAASATSNTNSINLRVFDLQMGETYYWRVDEVNNAEVESVWAGPVWRLTVADAVVVDDFERYDNDTPNRPFQTWLDGYGYSADEFFSVEYSGNGTGAGIGHDIWSVASDHYNGDIMETSNTMPGSDQSMPFYYSNSGGVASQTERTFAVPQDWTIGGAEILSMAFCGQAGNTGTLYVKINNTKVVYDSGSSLLAGIGRSLWQTWNIDLSSMDVQNVTTLQIGVDGSGASGMLLIDDIRLYIETVESISDDVTTPGDAVQGVPNDDDWPAAESPDQAIDDNTATKYLHRKGGSTATGFQVTPMVGATVVTGLTLTTANDVANRDPVTFELSGSNASIDGSYELIASGDVVDFAGAVEWPRLTPNETPIEFVNTVAYKHYQIVFPTLRGANETLMQIAEVELIIGE